MHILQNMLLLKVAFVGYCALMSALDQDFCFFLQRLFLHAHSQNKFMG